MRPIPKDIELALQKSKDMMARGNDSTHFSCFYDSHNIETGEKSLSIIKSLQYDNKKVINYRDVLMDGVIHSNSEADIDAYTVLQSIVPVLNENEIVLHVKKIAESILPWLKTNQVVVISDYPKESEMISVHPADPQTQSLTPTGDPFVVHWYPLVYSLMLFHLIDLTKHVGTNGKNKEHFMAMIFSLQNLEQRLMSEAGLR